MISLWEAFAFSAFIWIESSLFQRLHLLRTRARRPAGAQPTPPEQLGRQELGREARQNTVV